MYRRILLKAHVPRNRCNVGIISPSISLQALRTGINSVSTSWTRPLSTGPSGYESKYAEKLRKRAEEKGLSVDELKARAKKEQEDQKQRQRELAQAESTLKQKNPESISPPTSPSAPSPRPVLSTNVRKDSSPVKPLSSILNLPRILSTPHTPAQVSALWTAYHTSRSGGTGRGYVCASVPLELYQKMAGVAGKYSSFVIPVPRIKDPATPVVEGEEDTAYEFYFLQWGFHENPPVPTATEPDPFTPLTSTSNASPVVNPQTSTILFTPLQEYKLRGSFATPYLVLTHYTDLVHTHGIVLLRGEITPSAASAAGAGGRYLITQEDAQLLSMNVQKFYLWSQGNGKEGEREGERLLKIFHKKPEEFKWEDLLKHANWTI